jgi:hypothetical protein
VGDTLVAWEGEDFPVIYGPYSQKGLHRNPHTLTRYTGLLYYTDTVRLYMYYIVQLYLYTVSPNCTTHNPIPLPSDHTPARCPRSSLGMIPGERPTTHPPTLFLLHTDKRYTILSRSPTALRGSNSDPPTLS